MTDTTAAAAAAGVGKEVDELLQQQPPPAEAAALEDVAVGVVLYPPIYLEAVPYVLYFGDDAVDVIYEHCTPHELVRCSKVCRRMWINMPRIAERLITRLQMKIYNSPHVRVPNPGEVLFVNNDGLLVVAVSYYRQLRDILNRRILLIDNTGNRLDILDFLPSSNEPRWEGVGRLVRDTSASASILFRGEVYCIGGNILERFDILRRTSASCCEIRIPLELKHFSVGILDDKNVVLIGGTYDLKREGNEWDDALEVDEEGMVTDLVTSDQMYCLVDHPTDPSAATWALHSARLNNPRYCHASLSFEGSVWAAGGFDSFGGYVFMKMIKKKYHYLFI